MDAVPEIPVIRPAEVLRARIALSAGFLLLGLATGIWAVHIPLVQARLGLDPGTLGFALFAMAFGAVAGMPLTGWAVGRYGSRPPTAVLMIAYALVFALPILAPNIVLLFIGMVLFGAAMGGLDVAGNVQATEIEAARGRPTMSSFHGFYSVGGLAGSLLGAAIISLGFGDGSGAAAAAVVFIAIAAVAAANLLPSPRPLHTGPRFALPNRAVVGLGLLAFLCFASEGAIGDWSALYLSSVTHATAAAAATGYALYSCAMAFCRLTGDAIVARLGSQLTVSLGGGLIALGMAIAILSPWPLLGAFGFGLVGVGAANIIPVVFRASARVDGVPANSGIAATTTLGYFGFLLAPPLIGQLADAFGLGFGLSVVGLAGLVIAAMAASRQWDS